MMRNIIGQQRLAVLVGLMFTLFLVGTLNSNPTLAQSGITTLCDSSFNVAEYLLPPTFPGTYYRTVSGGNGSGENIYRFELINQFGSLQFDAPLTAEQTQYYSFPSISPDGEYMLFRPTQSDLPLIVWKINTLETATLSLSSDEYDYLMRENFISYRRSVNKLIWTDSNHLLLQFFSEDPAGILNEPVIAQTEITVAENPFQLIKGTETNIIYPELPLPSETNIQFGGISLSPQGNYTTLVSLQPVMGRGHTPRIQIYNNSTNQLLFDRIPSYENIPGVPIWRENEQTFFYTNQPSGLTPPKLLRVNVTSQGMLEDSSLQTALEASFGTETGMTVDPVFTSDGNQIAFQAYSPTQNANYVIIYRLDTGEIRVICNPFSVTNNSIAYPFWLSGEQYYAYWDNGDVNVFDINTGNLYQLPGRSFVGWIVPIAGLGNIPSLSLLASDNSIIAEPLANNSELSNLPSSVKFRANTNPATVGSVVFSLNGQVVGTSNTAPYDLNWTPLVGQHSLSATPYSGANGTGTAGSPYTANFSVTGNLNRILFRHNNHIYIMNADGSNPVDLGAGESPSFSPDGSQIAFQLNGAGGREIYLMNADGTNRRQLTNNNIDDRNPSFSPDGSRIVYCSVITGADWELWIMNADGSNKVQITHNSTDDADPVWSSNDVIAFSALTGGYRQIFTIWPDGSHRTLLTSGNSNKLGPEWSPDGSQLVYNSSGVSNEDVYRINADGSGGLRLTNHASSDIDADWSPDGS